jgi:hypothetical protein
VSSGWIWELGDLRGQRSRLKPEGHKIANGCQNQTAPEWKRLHQHPPSSFRNPGMADGQ